MLQRWGTEEYNHGYMIPFVAFYLFWLRAKDLNDLDPVGSWLGVVCLVLGLGLQLLGAMSAVYEIAQYGLVVSIWGVVIAAAGAAQSDRCSGCRSSTCSSWCRCPTSWKRS